MELNKLDPVEGLPSAGPSEETLDPSSIVALATANWATMVLLSCNRLRIFEMLSEGPRTAEELARQCGTDPRPTAMLLNAAVAHRLATRDDDGRYDNSAVTNAFLVAGRPAYLGDALKYSQDLYSVWGQLSESVLSGAPPMSPETILGTDVERTRNFVLGMHNRALGIASSLVRELDLTGRRRLLDVGGGPATYSMLLVKSTPSLRATVLDLPPVVEIAQEIIAESGCADRIETVGGDYRVADFGEGHDVILMSGMLHREPPESCRELLAKAFAALEPGGLVVVSDVFFDSDSHDSPAFATLFALTMFLTSEHGGAHAVTEMSDWMAAAGFGELEVSPLPPPMPHTIIIGTKPQVAS